MKGKKFFLVSTLTLPIVCFFYFLAVDNLIVIDRKIPFTYRQFLLEASSSISGKIVIESGSNSLHSFDAVMIEEYFNRPVIVLGDNAGYPLRHKIQSIKRHLNPGDILVLPLEWSLYIRTKNFSEDYVTGILNGGMLSGYYKDIPLKEKIEFIFGGMSLGKIFHSTVKENVLVHSHDATVETYQNSYSRIKKIFEGNDLTLNKNGSSKRNLDLSKKVDFKTSSCDQYLFAALVDPARNRDSKYFPEDLSLIKNMSQRQGIKVYFSWPTVVKARNDLLCYGALYNSYIKDVENNIINWVEQEGFSFIDSPKENVYSSECYLNTHYHIQQKCQKVRTSKLIVDLYSAGLRKADLNELNIGQEIMISKLDEYKGLLSKMYQSVIKVQ